MLKGLILEQDEILEYRNSDICTTQTSTNEASTYFHQKIMIHEKNSIPYHARRAAPLDATRPDVEWQIW